MDASQSTGNTFDLSSVMSSEVGQSVSGVVAVWTLVLALVVERFCHALVTLVVGIVVGSAKFSSRRLAGGLVVKEVVVAQLDVVRGLFLTLTSLVSYWIFFFTLAVLLGVLVLAAAEAPSILTYYISVYNSAESASLRQTLLLLSQWTGFFTNPFIIFWNFFVQLFRGITFDVLLPVALEAPTNVLKLASALASTIASLATSVFTYTVRMRGDCSLDDIFTSEDPTALLENRNSCFIPGQRSFDLITPLAQFRLVASYLLVITQDVCSLARAPMDLLLYPFLDINFAKAIHNLVNSFLYLFVNLPIVTVERCTLAKEVYPDPEHWGRLLLCLPDFKPAFSYAIAGVRRLGFTVDNWLNSAWMIVLATLGIDPPACEQIPLAMRKTDLDQTLFGGNVTRFVGLSTGLYAVTDGFSVQWVSFYGQIQEQFAYGAWGGGGIIEPLYGLAAVEFSKGSESLAGTLQGATSSIMGCRCADVPVEGGQEIGQGVLTEMQISCAILSRDAAIGTLNEDSLGLSAPADVPVRFFNPNTALYMKCSETKIQVQSARFPLWRLGEHVDTLDGRGQDYFDPLSDSTQSSSADGPDEVDMVLWVQPLCDASADVVSPQCSKFFGDAGCFPYCMAARQTGSRNDGLVLYGAHDWETRVQLRDTNCAGQLAVDAPEEVVKFYDNSTAATLYSYRGQVYSTLDIVGGQYYFFESWSPTRQTCTFNPTVTSRVSRDEVAITEGFHPAENFRPVLLDDQPFVFAGETALTLYQPSPGVYRVRVQRLYGQQGTNMFSLVTTASELEAHMPCYTLADCGEDNAFDPSYFKVTAPYSSVESPFSHNPAVMTKWAVLWATNPSYDMFSSFLSWCAGETNYELQVMVRSSHGPIRLFRANAFSPSAYTKVQGRVGATGTFTKLEESGFLDAGELTADMCYQNFNLRVQSMEYLNDRNVAVEVLYGAPRDFDPTNPLSPGANLRTRVYFLDPETMRIREGEMWQENDAVAVLSQGLLCPSQRRLPELGSITAEGFAGFLHLVSMFVQLVVTSPVVFRPGVYSEILKANPKRALGHTFLRENGIGWLNFDPVFQAWEQSQNYFWASITRLGSLFDNTPVVNTFLNGLAIQERAQLQDALIPAMRGYITAGSRIGMVVDEQIERSLQSVIGLSPVIFGTASTGSGLLNLAHYSCRIIRRFVLGIIGIVDAAVQSDSDSGSGAALVNTLWQSVYDTRADYRSLILANTLKGCIGLQAVLGYTNPFAKLARSMCSSSALLASGTVDVSLTFFVDIPVLSCLCKETQERNWRSYLKEQCHDRAPVHFRGIILQMVQQADTQQTLCRLITERVQGRIETAMDPFLSSSYEAVTYLSNTIDFVRIFWDDSAGTCEDISDPATITILPDPIDYFRSCGWTDTCRQKCLGVIQAFEQARDRHAFDGQTVYSISSGTAEVESRYFSDEMISTGQATAPFDVFGMAELATCVDTCGNSAAADDASYSYNSADRCGAIVGIKSGSHTVSVAEYCIPRRPDAHVSLSKQWDIANSETWALSAIDLQLGFQGRLYCHGYTGSFCSVVVIFSDRVSMFREDGDEYVLTRFSSTIPGAMLRVSQSFLMGNEAIVLNGVALSDPTSSSDRVERSLCVDTSNRELWGNFPVVQCDEQGVLSYTDQVVPVCIYQSHAQSLSTASCAAVLRIPTLVSAGGELGEDVHRCPTGASLQERVRGVVADRLSPESSCVVYPLAKGSLRSAGLFNFIARRFSGYVTLEQQYRTPELVIASSLSAVGDMLRITNEQIINLFVCHHPSRHTNWLSALRIDARAQRLRFLPSEPVQFEVEHVHGCTLQDCRGCSGVSEVRTLCYAAQSCTLQKCVGTRVNLDKYLCASGQVIGQVLEMYILQWHSVWKLVSQALVQTIGVAALGSDQGGAASGFGVYDEVFTSQVCMQKDIIFTLAGWLISFVNTNFNVIGDAIANDGDGSSGTGLFTQERLVFDMAAHVEAEKETAQRTLVMAALVRMFGNMGLALGPYPLMVARKSFVCQGNDLFAIADTFGMKIRITSENYDDRTDVVVGECLTAYEQLAVQEEEITLQDSEVQTAIAQVVSDSLAFVGQIPFSSVRHMLDGVLSWTQGFLRGVMDVIATADVKNCRLPDPTVDSLGRCACGDSAAVIPEVRAGEGLREMAFWCTGLLQMRNVFKGEHLVYNPFTYRDLVAMMEGRLEPYLTCLGSSAPGECELLEPQHTIFEQQGTSAIAVLSRCKANYATQMWDLGSKRLYALDKLPPYLLEFRGAIEEGMESSGLNVPSPMRTCMIQVLEQGLPTDVCRDLHLQTLAMPPHIFFSYSIPTPQPSESGSVYVPTEQIAACESFTGPAATLSAVDIDARNPFANCLSSTSSAQLQVGGNGMVCSLQPYVWSGRSRNDAPVADMHALSYESQEDRIRHAMAEYEAVSARVEQVLALMDDWVGDRMDVSLFSAEGDALHQMFDCLIMGPYARAELFPSDISEGIRTLQYYRDDDGGRTREFELPCTGEKLRGDIQPPFTCGSSARRSVIKSFLRDHVLNSQEGGQALRDAVIGEVRALVARTRAVFVEGGANALSCQCEGGGQSPTCCGDADNPQEILSELRRMSEGQRDEVFSTFIPPAIRALEFTVLSNFSVTNDIFQKIIDFTETELWYNRSVATHFEHGGLPSDPAAYPSDEEREIGTMHAYYDPTEPLLGYALDETLHAAKVSAFEACTGAVSQVFFTLPVASLNDSSTSAAGDGYAPYAPRSVVYGSMGAWDPTTAESFASSEAQQQILSPLEAWVQRLTDDAREHSPLFWSHRLKQLPSESLMCQSSRAAEEARRWATRSESETLLDANFFMALLEQEQRGMFVLQSEGNVSTGSTSYRVVRHTDGDIGGFADSIEPPTLTVPFESPLHQDAWALGKLSETCFCGWNHVIDTLHGFKWCRIPLEVCQTLIADETVRETICAQQRGFYQIFEHGRLVNSVFQENVVQLGTDSCPWNRIDAFAWGLVDEQAMHAALRTSLPVSETGANHSGDTGNPLLERLGSVTPKHLLYLGRAGLRYMNVAQRTQEGRQGAAPLVNIYSLALDIVQTRCVSRNTTNHIDPPEDDPLNFAEHFRDELFPSAESIREDRGQAFCQRYAIEYGTLLALEYVFGSDDQRVQALFGNTEESEQRLDVVRRQRALVDKWRRRCHTQTKLLGFCALRNVWAAKADMIGKVTVDPACKQLPGLQTGVFPVEGSSDSLHVVGSACTMVYTKRADSLTVLIDPCRAGFCRRPGEAVPQYDLLHIVSTAPALDPTTLLAPDALGLTLHWADPSDVAWTRGGASDVKAARDAYETRQAENPSVTSRFATASAGMKVSALFDKYLKPAEDSPHRHWSSRSGRRTTNTSESCSGTLDWWPEQWQHPVGFHVSTRCRGTRFRSFANHFRTTSLPPEGNETTRQSRAVLYSHSQLRNATLAMNYAGAAGVCRLNTYGVPLRETNNVRICTRQLTNEQADFAVPVKFPVDELIYDEEEACSTSPTEVPWRPPPPEHDTLGRMHSVGLLASWPDPEDQFWPMHGSDHLSSDSRPLPELGLAELSGPSEWGTAADGTTSCGLPPLLQCASTEDCERYSIFRDTPLQNSVQMECMAGVCTVVSATGWQPAQPFLQCTSHRDCAELQGMPNALCSGEGRCVVPVLEVINHQDEDIEIGMFSEECNADQTAVNTFGKSPWGRIPKLLQSFGLCSYKNWYSYLTVMGRKGCLEAGTESDTSCTLLETDAWVNTVSAASSDSASTIFQSAALGGVLYQEAHVCDRSYQHLPGYSLCVPNANDDNTSPSLMRSFMVPVRGAQRGVLPSQELTPHARYSSLFQTYYKASYYNSVQEAQVEEIRLELGRVAGTDNPYVGFFGVTESPNTTFDELALQACADIKQCSTPPFHVRGYRIASRQTRRKDNFYYAAVPYRLSDAIRCGPFGVLRDSTVSSNFNAVGACELDHAVLPFLTILCAGKYSLTNGDLSSAAPWTQFKEKCGSSFANQLFLNDNTERTKVCSLLTSPYTARTARDQEGSVPEFAALLYEMLTGWFSSGFSSLTEYIERRECAAFLHETLHVDRASEAEGGDSIYGTRAIVYDTGASAPEPQQVRSDSTLYIFTEFAAVEVPFAWWIKCTLMSSVKPSLTETTFCSAWKSTEDTSAVTTGATSASSFVPRRKGTVREYLQRYLPAISLFSVEIARERRLQELRTRLRQAIGTASAYLVKDRRDLTAECFHKRTWLRAEQTAASSGSIVPCSEDNAYQSLIMSTMTHGAKDETKNFVGQCCAGLDQCAPSSQLYTPSQFNHSLADLLEEWALENAENPFYQPYVTENPALLDSTITFDAPALPTFYQPWLEMESVPQTLHQYVFGSEKRLRGVNRDQCDVVTFVSSVYSNGSSADADRRCIFSDPTQDPRTANDRPPTINFQLSPRVCASTDYSSDLQSCDPNTDTRLESIPICVDNPTAIDVSNAELLKQPCFLAYGDGSDVQEDYVCQDSDTIAIGCTRPGQVIPNPAKNRVCYEMGSTCFNRNSNSRYANEYSYQLKKIRLPVGVRLRTFRYPEVPPLVGRNPLFRSPFQKQFWNASSSSSSTGTRTWFGLEDINTRLQRLRAKLGSSFPSGTVLETEVFTENVKIGTGLVTVEDYGARRRLLQADDGYCASGYVLKKAAEYNNYQLWYTPSAFDKCVACRTGEVKVENAWQYPEVVAKVQVDSFLDRFLSYGAALVTGSDAKVATVQYETVMKTTDGCRRCSGDLVGSRDSCTLYDWNTGMCCKCPDGYSLKPGETDQCYRFGTQDLTMTVERRQAVPLNVVLPPVLSWVEYVGNSPEFATMRFRAMQSYANSLAKYPSWYNCRVPSGLDGTAPTGKDHYPFRRLSDIIIGNEHIDELGLTESVHEWACRVKNINPCSPSMNTVEHRREYVAAHYASFEEKYFDWADPPSQTFAQTYGNAQAEEEAVLGAAYEAFSLELMPGFQCSRTCKNGEHGFQVYKGFYYCAPCTLTAPMDAFCYGTHGCSVPLKSSSMNVYRRFYETRTQSKRMVELNAEIEHTLFEGKVRNTLSAPKTLDFLLYITLREYRLMVGSEDLTLTTKLEELVDSTQPSLEEGTGSTAAPSSREHLSVNEALSWERSTGSRAVATDTNNRVMDIFSCLTTEDAAVNEIAYGQCSNDQQIERVKEFVDSTYRKQGARIIPKDYGMVMPLSAVQLHTHPTLLSWAAVEREEEEVHASYVLNSRARCAFGDISSSVCRLYNGKIELFNPWPAGEFSPAPGYGCDIGYDETQQIDLLQTICRNPAECPSQDDDFAFYKYQNPRCRGMDGQLPKRIVPKYAGNNLCNLRPTTQDVSGVCTHRQGLMGSGYVSDDTRDGVWHTNLYSRSGETPDTAALHSGGLFVTPRRELFYSKGELLAQVSIDKRFLRLDTQDIGGHHIVIRVKDGAMTLVGLRLQGRATSAEMRAEELADTILRHWTDPATNPQWTETLEADPNLNWLVWDAETEHRADLLREPLQNVGSEGRHWACPWKRRIYLSGAVHPDFRLQFPSGRRAERMFAVHSTGAEPRRSHTVQAPNAGTKYVNTTIYTSNGFCFCQDPTNCARSISSTDPSCSLRGTIHNLMSSNVYGDSMNMEPATCEEQLDWPYTGGTLRDGSRLQEDGNERSQCNLLHRLAPFRYRYRTVAVGTSVTGVAGNNEATGGDCYTAALHDDTERADTTIPWDPSSFEACGSCEPPPLFYVHAQDGATTEPSFHEIPAETSFGVPYRERADQAIAGNLRKQLHAALCAVPGPSSTDGSCTVLDAVVNVSSWVSTRFWDSFLHDLRSLFLVEGPASTRDTSLLETLLESELGVALSADEVKMWEHPWVLCERNSYSCEEVCDVDSGLCEQQCTFDAAADTPALPNASFSSSSIKRCVGTITHDEWMSPDTRGAACKREVSAAGDILAAIAPISVCDIDVYTDELCRVLASARQQVFDINCRVSGICHDLAFTYWPGAYVPSQQQYVKSIVEDFYLSKQSASCPAAYTESREIRDQNSEAVQNCPATQLQVVWQLLDNIRSIVLILIRQAYFFFMLVLNLLRLLFLDLPMGMTDASVEGASVTALGQVSLYWELWLREMGSLLEEVANLIFDLVIENSGFGQAMKELIMWICEAINWIYENLILGAFCPFLDAFAEFVDVLQSFTESLITGITLGIVQEPDLGDWRGDVLKWKVEVCNPDAKPCEWSDDIFDKSPMPTALPVATRCWSSFNDFLGNDYSFSCSAADTCRKKDLASSAESVEFTEQQVAGLVVCDQCPTPAEPASESRYGCNLITKQCSCGTPVTTRTTCLNNEECGFTSALAGSTTCDILDSFYRSEVYGTLPCSYCSGERICLVGTGASGGHCGCAIEPPEYSFCDETARGTIVSVPAGSMCLVAIGLAAAERVSSTATYTVQFRELASVRCDMLNAASRYCMNVEFDAGYSQHLVVGLETIFTSGSRRLLEVGGGKTYTNASVEEGVLFKKTPLFLAEDAFFSEAESTIFHLYHFTVSDRAFEEALQASPSSWERTRSLICRNVPAFAVWERALVTSGNNSRNNVPLWLRMGWDSTGASIGTVQASFADIEALRSCVRWRAVGKDLVNMYNLSGVVPETFMVSPSDFFDALESFMYNRDVVSVFRQPVVLLHAFMYSEFAAPLRTFVRRIRSLMFQGRIEVVSALKHELATQLLSNRNSSYKAGSNDTAVALPDGYDIQMHNLLKMIGMDTNVSNVMDAPTRLYYAGLGRRLVSALRSSKWVDAAFSSDSQWFSWLKVKPEKLPSGIRRHIVENRTELPRNLTKETPELRPTPTVNATMTLAQHAALTSPVLLHRLHRQQAENSVSVRHARLQRERALLAAKVAGGGMAHIHRRRIGRVEGQDRKRDASRTLLFSNIVDRIAAVQKYSENVALGRGAVQILQQPSAEEFVKGPVQWPPRYVYWGLEDTGGQSCKLGTNLFNVVSRAAETLHKSVLSTYDLAGPDSYLTKRMSLSNVSYNPVSAVSEVLSYPARRAAESPTYDEAQLRTRLNTAISEMDLIPRLVLETMRDTLQIDLLTFTQVVRALPDLVFSAFRCSDAERVIMCEDHRYSIFTSTIAAAILVSLVGFLGSYVGLPTSSLLLSILLISQIAWWIAFNYSPTCAPLIPLCLFESITKDLTTYLPQNLTVPQALLACPAHDQQLSVPPPSCIVKCEDAPFHFTDWSHTAAFYLCTASSPEFCLAAKDWLSEQESLLTVVLSTEYLQGVYQALYLAHEVMLSPDVQMQQAFTWCTYITSHRLIPPISVALFSFLTVPLLLVSMTTVLLSFVRAQLVSLAYTHT